MPILLPASMSGPAQRIASPSGRLPAPGTGTSGNGPPRVAQIQPGRASGRGQDGRQLARHVLVGEALEDGVAVLLVHDQAGVAQSGQVLRDVGL